MAKKIPNKIKYSVRYLALTALEKVFAGGAYSNLLLADVMKQANLGPKDSGLLTEIVYGTISRKLLLEFYLEPFTKKAKKIDPWVQNLLLLSAYQLTFLDKVPDHAVLNEAVEIAKARGNDGIAKFVNGVLRNYLRKDLRDTQTIQNPLDRLSIEISMPLWLVEKLTEQLGEAKTRELGESLLVPSKASGRVDLRVLSREEAIQSLEEDGLEVSASQVSPFGVVGQKGRLAASGLFNDGLLAIQDESSMLVAPTLKIAPQHKILDACAAPGGKTTHMATYLEAKAGGEIIALDIHQHKLKLVEDNARRLRVEDVITTKELDARKVQEAFPAESFDRILVDAPCSGLGLMRRKPDIKYTKKPEDFLKLAAIQQEILASVAPTLKKSGILTYSTCTITQEENQQVIAKFLEDHPDFKIIEPVANPFMQQFIVNQCIQLYPQDAMTDGFFICVMQKG
ncbi:16S rRNA (cytosine(967)-C(5))-methyltransferase RsmB [Enterococcus sp. LJL90]